MYLKYDREGDQHLLFIPDGKRWAVYYALCDDTGREDRGIYIRVEDEPPIRVLDTEYLCQGRPQLPHSAVGELYEEVIETISAAVKADSTIHHIDMLAVVDRLIRVKYQEIWTLAGYIYPDDRGAW